MADPSPTPATEAPLFPPIPEDVPADLLELPTIKQTNAGRLAALGIRSRRDLVERDYGELDARLREYVETRDIANRLDLIRGFAQAQLEDRPIVLAHDPVLMDPPGPVWFMDLEFDSEGSEIFIYGWKEWNGNVRQTFGASREERRAAMLEFFDAYYAAGKPLMVTYGSRNSDEPFLRRAAERFEIPRRLVDGLRWFDLQDRIVFTGSAEAQRLYLPLRSFKLDAVGRYFGRSGKPAGNVTSGLHVVHLYRRYKRTRDPRVRDRLLEYNAEDLYLSEAVFEGLREIFRTVKPEA